MIRGCQIKFVWIQCLDLALKYVVIYYKFK